MENTTNSQAPVVVIGDGWAALGLVGFLATEGKASEIKWITGTGGRIFPPLPTLDVSEGSVGAETWKKLAENLGISCGELMSGSYLREFRNKSFREPAWHKAPTPEARRDVRNESLWAPESYLVPIFEARFNSTMAELEDEIRKKLLQIAEEGSDSQVKIQRIHANPVEAFKIEDGRVQAVVLGSGESIACSQVFYADRWTALPAIQGMPKPIPFTRKREAMGVLQAVFTHEAPVGSALQEGFFGVLNKDAGEETERHVWGYFSADGTRSYWSVCLTQDEGEDNHQIAKKLRRSKSALDKMFVGDAWLPAGKSEFTKNLSGEQVRFEEAMIYASGDAPTEKVALPKIENLFFLTDGYGPASALHQVKLALELPIERTVEITEGPDPQAKGVDLVDPVSS